MGPVAVSSRNPFVNQVVGVVHHYTRHTAVGPQGRNPFVNQVVGVTSRPSRQGPQNGRMRRNPFVNQVVGVWVFYSFIATRDKIMSQSLRESGRWCQAI